jgi:uncharacterized repeat protein (TIGR03803 family)
MRIFASVVFSFLLTTGAVAQQVTTLFSFDFLSGNQSHAALIFDAAGNLYGTTTFGGTVGNGVVFRLTPNGDGTWSENTCYNFGEVPNDGANPYAGLSIDPAGNLYGTTRIGGAADGGTVFEMTVAPDGNCTETILHSFTGTIDNDGSLPISPVILDAAGNLYGTTEADGSLHGGTVFELSPPANGSSAWTKTILFNFNSNGSVTGYEPKGGMVFDAGGNLYGTTHAGGPGGGGTVFQLTPTVSGSPWKRSTLHNFGLRISDGADPEGTLAFDAAGNLYGTTIEFGSSPNGGTAFELSPVGHNWMFKVIYRFSTGSQPYAGLIPDAQGNVYGTTQGAGGKVFQLSPVSQGTWNFTDLGDLVRPGGSHPFANMIFGTDGNLYGTTSSAGAGNAGTVFTVAP